MIINDHFPNFGFACRAFLYSVRLLLTHPVYIYIQDSQVRCAQYINTAKDDKLWATFVSGL